MLQVCTDYQLACLISRQKRKNIFLRNLIKNYIHSLFDVGVGWAGQCNLATVFGILASSG